MRKVLRAIMGESFCLPADMVGRYPELAQAAWRRDGLFLRVGGWFLGRASVSGITLWRTIWISSNTPLHPELLLHELRHVHQFEADTFFPVRYLWQSVTQGYQNNSFEVDARSYAARRLRIDPPVV